MRWIRVRWHAVLLVAVVLAGAGLAGGAWADFVGGLNPQGDNYLSLRKGAGTKYREILRMEPNTRVTVLRKKGNWLRIRLDDGTAGWAYSKYIYPGDPFGAAAVEEPTPLVEIKPPALVEAEPPPAAAAAPAAQIGYAVAAGGESVPLRAGSGDQYDMVLTVPADTPLIILGQEGDWLRVLTEDGTPGFVASGSISFGEPGAAPPAPVATAPEPVTAEPADVAGPVGGAPAQPSEDDWLEYKNSRFGTSIAYPASLFVPQPPPVNNDGRSFSGVGGTWSFFLFGQYNALEMTLGELEADDIAGGGYDSVTYRRGGEDWYVLSGYRGGDVFYRKLLRRDDGETLHVFEISYPKQDKRTFDAIAARMAKSFAAPGAQGDDIALTPVDADSPSAPEPAGAGMPVDDGDAEIATAGTEAPASANTAAADDEPAPGDGGLAAVFRDEFVALLDGLR